MVLVAVIVICPLSLSIATTHPPCKQTLAAVVMVLVAIVVAWCQHSTHKSTPHPMSSCSRSWMGMVCCLLCTLTPYKQRLVGMEHVCEVSRCTAKAITLLVTQQWSRHQEALTLQVSPFMGLPAPLYRP